MADSDQQETRPQGGPNPARYARLSQPFESFEGCQTATDRFYEGLSKLRDECGIREVVCVVGGAYLTGGEAVEYVLPMQFGDASKAEPMAAYLLGHMERERAAMVARARGGPSRSQEVSHG